MLEDSFDPAKFVDRVREQEVFTDLLTFGDQFRIFELRDKSGFGKSHVLKMFRYICRIREPRVPVAFVDLKQLSDLSPLAVAKAIVDELRPFNLDFPEFGRVEAARVSADFTSIRGAAYFDGAQFDSAHDVRIAGTMSIVENAQAVHVSSTGLQLSPEQEKTAQDVSIRSFCAELAGHCNAQPVVILLDSLELCQDERLRKWLLNFLDHHAFDVQRRPEKLIVVLSGQSLPRLEVEWGKQRVEQTVKSVEQLEVWTRDHVTDCLRQHGFAEDKKHIDIFHGMVELGVPLSQVVQTMRSYLSPTKK